MAIDDEPIALSIIKEYCERYGGIHIECFTSPLEGMKYIRGTCPDLVLMDIEMNSHNGIELARALPQGTLLIFTTAYAEFALAGFNVNAVDFLHKPIFFPRFCQAMEKVAVWLSGRNSKNDYPEAISLKVEHKNVVIKLDTIKYIEAMDNYVKVFRKGLPTIVSQITMKEVEAALPVQRFKRVHRSYIVAMECIEKFSNRRIFIEGESQAIPVGRTYNDSFTSLYEAFMLSSRK
ncbi:MAG: response regulator transcription factor [Bacteroides sp.]|nr:response regulator transcription factor [Bacteroides sp.]